MKYFYLSRYGTIFDRKILLSPFILVWFFFFSSTFGVKQKGRKTARKIFAYWLQGKSRKFNEEIRFASRPFIAFGKSSDARKEIFHVFYAFRFAIKYLQSCEKQNFLTM